MLQNFWKLFHRKHFLQKYKHAMPQSPDNKGPICPVPQSCGKKYNQFIDTSSHPSPAVSSQRNIQIFLKPCRQGNMLASPKFLNISRNIRVIKILPESKTEHMPQSDRHITVTAEIKINLKQIGNRRRPCRQYIHL